MSAAQTPEQVLDRLDFTIIGRLDGLLQGQHRTLFRGGGIDFTDLRDYQPHDDTRHIDWNVTARMNSPFVRQFVEDRELTAWFLLDRSASMDFGGDPTKALLLTDTVISLARLLTSGGNRVGAVVWNHQVQSVIEPRGGRRQVLRLAKQLQKPLVSAEPQPKKRFFGRNRSRARTTGVVPSDRTPTQLGDLVDVALGTVRRRSLIFLVSDFISEPGWERPLAQLALRHDVVALRILDPAEVALPDNGLLVVEDAETGEQLTVDSSDRKFRVRFQQAVDLREQTITNAVRRTRADLHTISTDDDLIRSIVQIAHLRKRRTR